MRKLTLAAATAGGIAIGGVLFNAGPAQADLPTIDATVLAAVQAVKSVLTDQGVEPEPGPPEALAARIRADLDKWRDVIVSAGIHE